jgi:predicted metal-dependent HD superfamily phosphohydrolase
MPQANYKAAIAHALKRLRQELPAHLTYHDLWHTQFDVLPAVARMGAINRLSHDEICLMEVGAAFHDIGFIRAYQGHEAAGVRIMQSVLPDLGFNSGQIEAIAGMIFATRLPQSPRNLLEKIVVDADLDVLGRDDFFDRNELLRQELALSGRRFTWREWQRQQLDFLQGHTYFTPVARALRDEGKQRHIQTIQEWLKRGYGENGAGRGEED